MKRFFSIILTLIIFICIAYSCTKSVQDNNYVRCTCTYTDSKGVKQTIYDDLDKSQYPTTADQQSQCNLFGASLSSTASCKL